MKQIKKKTNVSLAVGWKKIMIVTMILIYPLGTNLMKKDKETYSTQYLLSRGYLLIFCGETEFVLLKSEFLSSTNHIILLLNYSKTFIAVMFSVISSHHLSHKISKQQRVICLSIKKGANEVITKV